MGKYFQELLTIIIPVYNRYDEAIRLYKYFRKYLNRIDIVVLDNSIEINNEFIKIIESPKTFYKIYISEITYSEKLFKGIKDFVKTKYSVICAQDDFITIQGLMKSIGFLEKNSEYVICHGKQFRFRNNSNISKNIIYEEGRGVLSVDNDDLLDRLRNHISKYTSTFYAVHRTEILEKIWRYSFEYTDDLRFGELLPSHLSCVYGKIKALDILFYLREYSLRSDGHTAKTINDYFIDNSFHKKYEVYKKCLIKESRNNDAIDEEKVNKIIDESFQEYLGNSFEIIEMKSAIKRFFNRIKILKILFNCYKNYVVMKNRKNELKSGKIILYLINNNQSYVDFIRIKNEIETKK